MLCALVVLVITQWTSCVRLSQLEKSAERIMLENQSLQEENEKITTDLRKEKSQKADLEMQLEETKMDAMLTQTQTAFEVKDWQQKTIEFADLLHKAYADSDQDRQGQDLKDQAENKLEEKKAADDQKQKEQQKAQDSSQQKKEKDDNSGVDGSYSGSITFRGGIAGD